MHIEAPARKRKKKQRLPHVPPTKHHGVGMGSGLAEALGGDLIKTTKATGRALKHAGKPLSTPEKKALQVIRKPATAAASLTPKSRKAILKPSAQLQFRIAAEPGLPAKHRQLKKLMGPSEPPEPPRATLPERPISDREALRNVERYASLAKERTKPEEQTFTKAAEGIFGLPHAGATFAKEMARGLAPQSIVKAVEGKDVTGTDVGLDALFFGPWGRIARESRMLGAAALASRDVAPLERGVAAATGEGVDLARLYGAHTPREEGASMAMRVIKHDGRAEPALTTYPGHSAAPGGVRADAHPLEAGLPDVTPPVLRTHARPRPVKGGAPALSAVNDAIRGLKSRARTLEPTPPPQAKDIRRAPYKQFFAILHNNRTGEILIGEPGMDHTALVKSLNLPRAQERQMLEQWNGPDLMWDEGGGIFLTGPRPTAIKVNWLGTNLEGKGMYDPPQSVVKAIQEKYGAPVMEGEWDPEEVNAFSAAFNEVDEAALRDRIPSISGGAPTRIEQVRWKLGMPEVTKGLREKFFPKPGPARTTPQAVERHLQEVRDVALEEGKGPFMPPKKGELTKREKEVRRLEAVINAPAPKGLTGYEAIGAKLDAEKAVAKATRRLEEIQLSEHGTATKERILDVMNIPRSIMASWDLSAPLRQGLMTAMARPGLFKKNFGKMIKEFGSENVFQASRADILARPNYPIYRKMGVDFTDIGGHAGERVPLFRREEQFYSNYAEKIPGIRNSDRAYVGFLNATRADYADRMIRDAAAAGWDLTDKHTIESLGRYVNAATGRGDLGVMANHAETLNTLLFSPRLMMSRFNFLNPAFYMRLHPAARKEALRAATHLVAFMGTVLYGARAGGAEVGLDPASANFGKVKIGNTRIDFAGGFNQQIRLIATLMPGILGGGHIISSTTGRSMGLSGGYGKSSRFDILLRFGRSKLGPVPSVITDILSSADFGGKPLSAKNELAGHMIPLLMQDAYDLANEHGGLGTSKGAAAFGAGYGIGLFGIGEQTYGPKKTNVNAEIAKLKTDSKAMGLGMPPKQVIADVQWKAALDDQLQTGMKYSERAAIVVKLFDERYHKNYFAQLIPQMKNEAEAQMIYEDIRSNLFPSLAEWESSIESVKRQRAGQELVHSSMPGPGDQAGGEDPRFLNQLASQISLIEQKTGQKMPAHHIGKLRGDAEAVKMRDNFLNAYAQSQGGGSFHNLSAKARLLAAISFMVQHRYLDPQDARVAVSKANQLQTDAEMEDLATELWSEAGVGEVSDQWQGQMAQYQPPPLEASTVA